MIKFRKDKFPGRPLIRISSTFFWHLSSDYDLIPIRELAAKAQVLRADQVPEAEDEVIYEPMKVGQQVSK
jgi:hypothetical protein